MSYEIPNSDLNLILKTLEASPDPEVKRALNQLHSQSLIEDLKQYDPPHEFLLHIHKLCHYLKHWFSLEDWTGYVKFENLPVDEESDAETKATIRSDGVYLNYTLRIGVPILECWRRKEWSTIGLDLCHEFCHIMTDPIIALAMDDAAPSQTSGFRDINERQVQRLAVIIHAALPDDYYTPEKLDDWIARHPGIEMPKPKTESAAA